MLKRSQDTNRKALLQTTQIDASMFWLLVFAIWMAGQVPVLGKPFRLLATWVHELGHGLGAILTGGSFDQMVISPNFSGLAHTFTGSDWQRVIVLLGGLLGPACAGAIMLIMTRRFNLSRLALFLLSAALIATLVLWAGDNFTRFSVLGFAIVVTVIAVKAPPLIRSLCAHIIALSFCLNAVVDFGYFFMSSKKAGLDGVVTDTSALANIVGGPHIFWALVPSILSIIILFGAFRLSGGFGHKRKT